MNDEIEQHGQYVLRKRQMPAPHDGEFFFEIGLNPQEGLTPRWERHQTYPTHDDALAEIRRREGTQTVR